MAKNKKRTQLSSEGKTELAKAIAEKSQNFAKTYANVENQIGKFFRWLSGWLDKLLFNQKHGKLVALVLALFFYIAMSGGEDLFKTDEISKSLGKLKVEQRISTEIYEVNNLPDEVEVTAIGDISDIKNMKSQNIKIVANMTDLTEGTHDVTLEVENAPNRVKIIVEPSNATVTIKKKVIKRFSVGFDYVNRSSMNNRYDLSEPELEQGEVFVRASKDTLDKIAYVKALIKVDADTTKDFEQQATIVAYDQDGNKMDNVDIIPGDMKAKVKVTSPSKDVKLTLVPTGNVPDNKAIESYTMDHETITLYGKQEALDKIDELLRYLPVH
jgi:YbbR domain-containing protein